MERGLDRIETTLSQVNVPGNPVQPILSNQTCSFEISNASAPQRPSTPETVQPFPVEDYCPKTPLLPKFKLPSFSNHRHVTNPQLALGLLHEIETIVTKWQVDLQQLMLQIQAVYLEGPIVDGWLESQPHSSTPTSQMADLSTLRHAEVDDLMDYVQKLCETQPQTTKAFMAEEAPRAGYRLCGLDSDGQMWCRPCPPDQLPYVSLAIARYQKLRQMLVRKHDLETKLSNLAKTLVTLHADLQEG